MEKEGLEAEVKAIDEQLLKVSTQYKTADTIAKDYQIHLLVDRIRTPEPLFQPHLCGLDQAGLGELLANLLARTQPSLFADVFLTGGTARFPGFTDRIQAECRAILPQGFPLKVQSHSLLVRPAGDLVGDAWRGAAQFLAEHPEAVLSRAQYQEQVAGTDPRAPLLSSTGPPICRTHPARSRASERSRPIFAARPGAALPS